MPFRHSKLFRSDKVIEKGEMTKKEGVDRFMVLNRRLIAKIFTLQHPPHSF